MVKKFIGKHYSVGYSRKEKTVQIVYKHTLVFLKVYRRVCDAVDFFASLKNVSDIKELLNV